MTSYPISRTASAEETSTMRTSFARPAGLIMLAALALVATVPAQAADRPTHKVERVDVQGDDRVATVLVRGWHEPTFSVFRLDDPARVVVDLKDGDVSGVVKVGVIAGRGPIVSVTARQFDDPQASVGRLYIAVKDGAKYDVAVSGNDLSISVRLGEAAPKAVAEELPLPPPETPAAAPAPTIPGADDKVVRIEDDRMPGDVKGGTHLTEAKLTGSGDSATLFLKADGPVVGFRSVELKEPGRLALDLQGFSKGIRPRKTSAGPIVDLRIGRHEDRVRVVLETNGQHFPSFEVKRIHNGLVVTVGVKTSEPVAAATPAPAVESIVTPAKAKVEAPKAEVAKVEAPRVVEVAKVEAPATPATAPVAEAPKHGAAPSEVKSLDVSGHGRTTRVVLAMTGQAETAEQKMADGTRVLIIRNARLPKELVRKLDTSALEGPLASVASYMDPSDGSVRIVSTLRSTEPDVTSTLTPLKVGPSFGLSWHFAGNGTRNVALAALTKTPGGFMGEAPAYAMNAGPRATSNGYTGKRVDFTAKDLEIIQFLQAIGEIAKRNIVASDDVGGKISVRLRNVPWDEALDIVLKTKGLSKEEIGSVIRVAPAERLAKEHADQAAQAKNERENTPLKVRLIPVNFAPADRMATQVKDLLTQRGTVTVDSRTNMLIVKDIPDSLTKAELLVRTLDTQTPQVLIEARIVEATTSFSRSFGIQWGGNAIAAQSFGTQTGLAFPNVIGLSGVSNDGPTSGNQVTPNYVVNFPTAVGQGNGAGLGFIFGSANGAQNLNLRLTAAELGGTVKTVSAPKAVTLDNESASIGQGLQIPYNVVSAAGANTAFVQARLQLTVTPHVTADGSVVLKIDVTNNQPNTGVTGANGQPSIQTREATTNVLVKDGDTTVIGGIYTRSTSRTDNEVPFLGKLPIIGALFSHNVDQDDRDEMLIFITPRIINRQQSVVATGSETGLDSAPPPAPAP
jgi:type IV pilus assembly protein PilQ